MKENVELLRKRYPVGTRIVLNHMADPYVQLPPGLKGTVAYVDDMGNIGMLWDNGCTLALVPGADRFSVVSTPKKHRDDPER